MAIHHAPTPGRRAVIGGIAGGTALTVAGTVNSDAHAASTALPALAPYRATRIPNSLQLHFLNRWSSGFCAPEFSALLAAGSAEKWFLKQLNPASINDSACDAVLASIPGNTADPVDRASSALVKRQTNACFQEDFIASVVYRRAFSKRQLLEVMTAFWTRRLHVPLNAAWATSPHYEATLRKYALGRFEDLLQASITSPAMMEYLHASVSTKDRPNEDLGREVLELHTVGLKAGYTEEDVKNSARVLTGWKVDQFSGRLTYLPNDHYVGPIRVLGFTHSNSTPGGGPDVLKAMLRYLARHPATARRLCQKLVFSFVDEKANTALIESLAKIYLANDTAIAPVLTSLMRSAEFRAAKRTKIRTPIEDGIATLRTVGLKFAALPEYRPVPMGLSQLNGYANWTGQRPFDWATPDGFPEANTAWISPGRVLATLDTHYSATNPRSGYWAAGVTWPSAATWVPKSGMRFDLFIDHVHRRVLGVGASRVQLAAATQGLGRTVGSRVYRSDALLTTDFPRLMSVVLDTPQFMVR